MKRSLIAGTVLPTLVAGVLSAAPPTATPATTPVPAVVPGHLSMDRAAARPRATGRSVVVSALTTPTSETTVNPAGRFTDTETLSRTRVWRAGAWHDLDVATHDVLAPAATTAAVTLSDGGSAPLVTLDSAGRTMQ
ncbi:MAG TPA: hypothetical protein VGL80_16730 [Pseudonocardiaceae bacterium]